MEPLFDEDLSIGDTVADKYEILSVVGRGSMGVVYKARHRILGRHVAIKTLRIQRLEDERSLKRFEREAKTASLLDHPNIIAVYDFGLTDKGQPFLVMDFIHGTTMQNILRKERTFSASRTVNLFAQVCAGLQHAHQKGVIHRDLKPANIVVVDGEEGESVKVVDLGVAKVIHGDVDDGDVITSTGEVCGSPIYLSPEQCRNESLDSRSDIYSLGVVIYECLCGTPPLRGATVFDTIYMHVHESPVPINQVRGSVRVPPALEAAVMRALAKDPRERQASMSELRRDLLAALDISTENVGNMKVLAPEEFPFESERDETKETFAPASISINATSINTPANTSLQQRYFFWAGQKRADFRILAGSILLGVIALCIFYMISKFYASSKMPSVMPVAPVSSDTKARREAMIVNQQGRILAKNGHYFDAIKKFSEALSLDPSYSKAAENIGRMYYNIGLEQSVSGKLEPAELSFRQSLKFFQDTVGSADEKTVAVRAELVKVLRLQGKTKEAGRLERNF